MKRQYWICALAVSVMWMVAALPHSARAMAPALPPRPTPEPRVVNASAGGGGGLIELRIQGKQLPAKLWTTVQWQNEWGDWYTVEGWQGVPWEDGRVLWWVQHSDLGKGPFRWMVYSARGGNLVATSGDFYLPSYDGAAELIAAQIAP